MSITENLKSRASVAVLAFASAVSSVGCVATLPMSQKEAGREGGRLGSEVGRALGDALMGKEGRRLGAAIGRSAGTVAGRNAGADCETSTRSVSAARTRGSDVVGEHEGVQRAATNCKGYADSHKQQPTPGATMR
jgi:hypothetical protein